jgi:hypothetical protein
VNPYRIADDPNAAETSARAELIQARGRLVEEIRKSLIIANKEASAYSFAERVSALNALYCTVMKDEA